MCVQELEMPPAAQIVIEHLRRYGPNARVVIIGPDFTILREVALEGERGLFKMYGDEFTDGPVHRTQFNHVGGGQVLQIAQYQADLRLVGQIFTCVWCESPDKVTPEMQKAVKMARERIKNGIFVQSSGGIVENFQA